MLWADFCWSILTKESVFSTTKCWWKHFSKKLFSRDRFFMPRKCFRCDYFCVNSKDEKTHNFLSHYQHVGRKLIVDKPLKRIFFEENLQSYSIHFSEHDADYNFYDSWELVSDFMTVFENAFVPLADLRQVKFKCSFTIVNRQPVLRTGFVEIPNSRMWQTNVYEAVYFNDFIKSNLMWDILKRVI